MDPGFEVYGYSKHWEYLLPDPMMAHWEFPYLLPVSPHLSPSLNHRIGWWDNLQPWFPVNFPLNQSSDLTMPNFHMTKVQFLFPWRSPRFVWGWSPMNWSSEMPGENWSKSPEKNSLSRCLRWYFFPIFGGLEHEFYFSIILGRIIPTDELHHFSEG